MHVNVTRERPYHLDPLEGPSDCGCDELGLDQIGEREVSIGMK